MGVAEDGVSPLLHLLPRTLGPSPLLIAPQQLRSCSTIIRPPLSRVGQLAAVVYDCIWLCLEEEEKETGKRETKRVEERGRDVGTMRERVDGGGKVVVFGGGRR